MTIEVSWHQVSEYRMAVMVEEAARRGKSFASALADMPYAFAYKRVRRKRQADGTFAKLPVANGE